jgi:hypothetical protein
MTDGIRREEDQPITLPLTDDDLRKLARAAAKEGIAESLMAQLEELPPGSRDSVLAILDVLISLRAIPSEHHALVRRVLTLFNRLTDEQRTAYLRLTNDSSRD